MCPRHRLAITGSAIISVELKKRKYHYPVCLAASLPSAEPEIHLPLRPGASHRRRFQAGIHPRFLNNVGNASAAEPMIVQTSLARLPGTLRKAPLVWGASAS